MSASSSNALATIGSHANPNAQDTGFQTALEKAHSVQIKANMNKDGWETSDFPILCETCLGPNPFVRMAKEDFGIQCKICSRPFTLFKWKPGAEARYKATVICQTCARLKNTCQTCLFDLEYGLPVQVRDQYLAESEKIAMPDSNANREYYINQQSQKIESGELPYGKEKNPMLAKMARKQPYYARNQARICSFFVKGTCNRGDECPFRHEMPQTGELAKQNIFDRFHGRNDPLANKINRVAAETMTLKPPDDKTITTLYVGGVDPLITEQDLRNSFYVHGELRTIKMVPKQSCAFVVYKTRAGAEAAAENLFRNLRIKGHKLRVQWGQKSGDNPKPTGGASGSGAAGVDDAVEPGPLGKKNALSAPAGPMKYSSQNPMNLNNAPLPEPLPEQETLKPMYDEIRLGSHSAARGRMDRDVHQTLGMDGSGWAGASKGGANPNAIPVGGKQGLAPPAPRTDPWGNPAQGELSAGGKGAGKKAKKF